MPVKTLSETQHASTAATAASAAEPPAASTRKPTSAVAGWPAATPAGTRLASSPAGCRAVDDRTAALPVGRADPVVEVVRTLVVTRGSVEPLSQFWGAIDSIAPRWSPQLDSLFTRVGYSAPACVSVMRLVLS
jgi:hypothetical protein